MRPMQVILRQLSSGPLLAEENLGTPGSAWEGTCFSRCCLLYPVFGSIFGQLAGDHPGASCSALVPELTKGRETERQVMQSVVPPGPSSALVPSTPSLSCLSHLSSPASIQAPLGF